MAKTMMSTCGLDCGSCEWHMGERQPSCVGCTEIEGKPFWGTCPTYSCARERNTRHCGSCSDFPCDKFIEMFDPNDPEGRRSAVYRAGIEAYRTRHGDEKTVDLIRKTAKSQ